MRRSEAKLGMRDIEGLIPHMTEFPLCESLASRNGALLATGNNLTAILVRVAPTDGPTLIPVPAS